ncbi:MAG: flagellar assembly protein FliH [Burkholderiales bacterium]|nr:flagellar assembly protein FliH [Burkholderiales bacterium]
MTSFGDQRPSTLAKLAAEQSKKVVVPSQEEIDRMRELALQEGYATGHESGLEEGFRKGHMEGLTQGLNEGREQAALEIGYLHQLAQDFGQQIAHADTAIAHDMLDLALDIAKAMLKTALQVKPELVLPVIVDAVQYLPSLHQPALLIMHPDDSALVHAHMGDELEKNGWRVIEDESVGRGGCRIDTANNQIDASAATRWQRIASVLGKNLDWLE